MTWLKLVLLASSMASASAHHNEDEETDFLHKVAYPVCCSVSNLFLLATIAVYLYLPELRSPAFGKIILAFLTALTGAYLSISVMSAVSVRHMMGRGGCQALGFAVQFAFLHAFFWMNVLCFDIYRKFTRKNNQPEKLRTRSKASTTKRLWKYAVYAVGTPLAVTAFTMAVELMPSEMTGRLVRPDFGVSACFFDTRLANFLYFHMLVILVQLANLAFFMLTVRALRATWAQSAAASLQSKNVNRFWVIAKLYVVMGGTWLFEVTGFLLAWKYGSDVMWKYQIASYTVNALQGVLIFAALICKRDIFKRLFCPTRPDLNVELRNHAIKMIDLTTRQSNATASTVIEPISPVP